MSCSKARALTCHTLTVRPGWFTRHTSYFSQKAWNDVLQGGSLCIKVEILSVVFHPVWNCSEYIYSRVFFVYPGLISKYVTFVQFDGCVRTRSVDKDRKVFLTTTGTALCWKPDTIFFYKSQLGLCHGSYKATVAVMKDGCLAHLSIHRRLQFRKPMFSLCFATFGRPFSPKVLSGFHTAVSASGWSKNSRKRLKGAHANHKIQHYEGCSDLYQMVQLIKFTPVVLHICLKCGYLLNANKELQIVPKTK